MLGTVPGSGDSVRNRRHTCCLQELILQVGRQSAWREETDTTVKQTVNCSFGQCHGGERELMQRA